MSFAGVFIPEFPVAAWQRKAQHGKPHPRVVLEGVPPQEKVVSRNEAARAAGVAHGMSKVQAEAACRALFRTRQVEEEEQAFASVFEVAERFSPRAEAIASPTNAYGGGQSLAASLLIDSSGMGTLFGSPGDYARKLYQDLRAAGFPARVGVAPNAKAALLLAQGCKGVACADAGDIREKLAPLRTSLLPCEPRMLEVLRRWGIQTLGELAALPETALIGRLGQQGRRLQQLARGEADHLLVPEEPTLSLSETMVLDTPVEMLESLLFVLSPMLETILRRAMGHAYALRSLCLILLLEKAEPHVLQIRPATPTQSREALLKLLNLELQARPPSAGILSITLNAEAAQPQTAQRGLFQTQFPEPDKLDILLARLRSIAGQANVGSPQLLNSHRDDAFTVAEFQPHLTAVEDAEAGPQRLAVRVFRPSQPVRVTCWGNRPHMLLWQGARLAVQSCAGPWHSSGSWWDGEAWDNDLWDVVTADPSQALRLKQEHASNTWFVVGLYD